MSASGSVRPGFFTSPPMNDRSAQPSYVHMIVISAVPISDSSSPPCQAGVKWEAPRAVGREREQRQGGQRAELGDRRQVHHHRRAAHAHVVERAHGEDGHRGHPAYLRRLEMDEVAEVLGEDRSDGAEGGCPDDGELGPAEQERRKRAEAFEDVGEHAARPRHRRCQLGVGEGAEQRDQPADDPGEQHWSRLVQLLRDAGRHAEDAAPDRRPHEHRDGAAEAEVSGEPFTPCIALDGHGLNIALTRLCQTRSFPAI